MPFKDKTGPAGAGPRTGLGAGGCPPETDEAEKSIAIKRLYRDAGFAPPKGKGIHTEKFHRCVVDVKKKIRDGKMPAGSNAHAICMNSIGVEGSVKPEHRQSKAAKGLMSEAMLIGAGRRTSQGNSRAQMLLNGLEVRQASLNDLRNNYIAEIGGYADAMRKGDWNNKYAIELIEHAIELKAILEELASNTSRQDQIRAEMRIKNLKDPVSKLTIGDVEAKEGP